MPKIERTPSGNFRIRYIGPDGKRRCKTLSTARALREWWAVESATMVKKEWISPDLGDRLFRDWADHVFTVTAPVRRANTRSLHEQYYRTIVEPRWGDVPLAELRREDIVRWVAE